MPDIPTGALVGAAKAVSRFKPWAIAKRHDRLVRQEYEDLLTFARDGLDDEARALDEVRSALAARGMLYSGQLGADLRRVRDDFARRWRDFKRASDRRVAEMREVEGLAVKAWRATFRRPWPADPNAAESWGLVQAWEDEAMRQKAVEREVAPHVHAELERAVWFMPEEKIWNVDQAAGYRGQIGNRAPGNAFDVMAQMVAETGEPRAESVLVGDLDASESRQREFQVMCPHPSLYCLLKWHDDSGKEFSYTTGQVFPANPAV